MERKSTSTSGHPHLSDEVLEEVAQCCKLLSECTRLRIILLLGFQGDMHVRGLCERLGLNQPAVSHHLAILKEAGVIELRSKGQRNYYTLIREPLCRAVKNLIRSASNGKNTVQYNGLVVRLDDSKV